MHCGKVEDRNIGFGGLLSDSSPYSGRIGTAGWADWLARGLDEKTLVRIRCNTATGRPCGDDDFVTRLEEELDRI